MAEKKKSKRKKKKPTLSQTSIALICVVVIAFCFALTVDWKQIGKRQNSKIVQQEQVIQNSEQVAKEQSQTQVQSRLQASEQNKTDAQSKNQTKNLQSENSKIAKNDLQNSKTDSQKIQSSKTTQSTKTESNKASDANQTKSRTVALASTTQTNATKSSNSTAKSQASVPAKTTSTVTPPAGTLPEIPSAVNNAKLVFVFDDAGQNLSQLEKYLALPFPITVAVLPKLPHSKESANRIRASSNEIMLHQPMQAINLNVNPGPGAITPDMQSSAIINLVSENIAEIGPIAGINNHEGSLITEDQIKIGAVMTAANNHGAFFMDSRTSSQTRVPQASMELGIPYYERNVFLDNTKNRSDILNEILRGLNIANRQGAVIMIGHIWSADVLPPILQELYPILKAKGYTFTTVSKSGALKRP
ncbi:MAG: divergent polysaccharide deacetylase family protein [Treponema sp.]|nr:divergent polysaccharide deacetylase family protein [Treponema sp.]